MSEFVKVATTAVIEHGGKVLIGKREKDGRWEFPGGRIDPGETPQQCIIREIKEELGIDAKITHDLGRIDGTFRGMKMELYAFVCQLTAGEVQDHVHTETKWVDPSAINKLDFIEEDWVVLEKYK